MGSKRTTPAGLTTSLALLFISGCGLQPATSHLTTGLHIQSPLTPGGDSQSSAATASALNTQILSGDWALDYVIQDVCVDSANHPISGDPAVCPDHRNLQIGERVPYLLTDVDKANGNATYQALSSYPVPGTDGTLKVMFTKSNQGGFDSSYQFSFDAHGDGYDLLDTSGPYFSFIRTSDGGCYDQEISTSTSKRQDGWIVFSPNGGGGHLVHSTLISRLSPDAPSGCARTSQSAASNDVWNEPEQVTFETGKNLSSIVTYHYADQDFSSKNNALERYYFTREYGFTRWEAWIPTSRCMDPLFAGSPASKGKPEYCDPDSPSYPLRGRCSPGNIRAVDYWGNQEWVRIDCRDSTNYIALTTPMIPLDHQMAQSDGLVDVNSAWVLDPQNAWTLPGRKLRRKLHVLRAVGKRFIL